MKRLELAGRTFGNLTVRAYAHSIDGLAMWECLCACGAEVVVRGAHMKNGLITSCGCHAHPEGNKSVYWKGCGDIPGQRWNQWRHLAKTRGISFEITIEEAWTLFLRQNGLCALSGVPLVFGRGRRSSKSSTETTASLDRIDSSGDYTWGNVQWVHKDVNMKKRALSNTA